MAMIGDLQSFALPELLRTLGNSRQSGQLSVWSHAGVYRIWFRQGSVTAAIAPQPEGLLKALCLKIMGSVHEASLETLRPSKTALEEPLGDWLRRQNWLTETEQRQIFQSQLNSGLYPLFELASGQFYFVGDMVPLPYWEMTGLEILSLEALSQGLHLKRDITGDLSDLPPLDQKFLALTTTSITLRLSLLDRRLLQWFRQPNTIQSLCQVLKVEPLELQKACKRLIHLQLIQVDSDSTAVPEPLPAPQATVPSLVPTNASHRLVQQIAAVLNKPVMGKPKLV